MSKDEKTKGKRHLSLKTHRKGLHKMDTEDLGSSERPKVASSKEMVKVPSERTNSRFGSLGTQANNSHLNVNSDSSLAIPKTETSSEKCLDGDSSNQSNREAPASFQERNRSITKDLFTSGEFMFLGHAQYFGLKGAYRQFSSFVPPVDGVMEGCRSLPAKLRAIADEIDTIITSSDYCNTTNAVPRTMNRKSKLGHYRQSLCKCVDLRIHP
jgi:hypothetical protein